MKKYKYIGIALLILALIYVFIPDKKEDETEEIKSEEVIVYTEDETKLMEQDYFIKDNMERYLSFLDGDNYSETVTAVNSNIDKKVFKDAVPTNMDDGELVLVNKYTHLSSNYIPENLVNFTGEFGSTNRQLKKVAYDAFIEMATDAKEDGYIIYAMSTYRSYEVQAGLYNDYKARDGESEADTYSARPSFSEHQTGLAVDVSNESWNILTFEQTSSFKWMKNNAYKYGFILRYPEGKTFITGYQYEPWHYRYVGTQAAEIIQEHDITFEEYHAYYVK